MSEVTYGEHPTIHMGYSEAAPGRGQRLGQSPLGGGLRQDLSGVCPAEI